MGGHRVGPQGGNDSGFDIEGYDESQRAELVEALRDGPSDGTLLTDIPPDLGGDPMAADEDDDLVMTDDELGEEDEDVDSDEDDMAEDALQEDFDLDAEDLDEELDDGDDVALRP
jgi:DNA-directed RNA polymerase subunit delta